MANMNDSVKRIKKHKYTDRPTNNSPGLIIQAAFYFNHINEAFNLAACLTS